MSVTRTKANLPPEEDECPGTGKCHGCLQWCLQCGNVGHVCDARLDGKRCDAHPVPPSYSSLSRDVEIKRREMATAERVLRETKEELEQLEETLRARVEYDRQTHERDNAEWFAANRERTTEMKLAEVPQINPWLPAPLPFIKSVGGKRRLLGNILPLVPKNFGRYIEPFLGGGALFFALRPPDAWIGDINKELMTTYCGVMLVDDIIPLLAEHAKNHAKYGKEYFTEVKNREWSEFDCAETAARMIYINKTCFNGLYRVNKSGRFNVPFGRYENPKILDKDNLRACAQALDRAGVQLHHAHFGAIERHAEKGDFVYFDSPYVPVSKTANFVGYSANGFDEAEHRKLADLFAELTSCGVKCLLSNSDTPLVRELYKDFVLHEVSRSGTMNSSIAKRGRVGELLVQGWAW